MRRGVRIESEIFNTCFDRFSTGIHLESDSPNQEGANHMLINHTASINTSLTVLNPNR